MVKKLRINYLKLTFCGILLIFVLQQLILPVRFLFVDDWVFLDVLAGKNLSIESIFQFYNNHQMALTKSIWWIYGLFWNGNPVPMAVFNSFCLLGGFFFLTNSQIKQSSFRFLPISIILVLLITNLKQIINVTTIITTSWALGILFVGLYFHLKNLRQRNCFFYIIVLLSPFTNGVGLLVPISEFCTNGVRLIVDFLNKLKLKKIMIFDTFIAGTALFFSYLFPMFLIQSEHQVPLVGMSTTNSETYNDSLNFFGLIIHYIRWALILVGSVFTPSTRFNPLVAETMASILILYILCVLIKFRRIQRFFHEITNPGNSTFVGVTYILGIIVTRGDPIFPLIWATSPRYTSGTVIFVVGVFAALMKSFDNLSKNPFKLHTMVYSLVTPIVLSIILFGMREGYIYQKLRHDQAEKILACVNDSQNLDSRIQDLDCFDYIYIYSSYNTSKANFVIELNKYLRVMR